MRNNRIKRNSPLEDALFFLTSAREIILQVNHGTHIMPSEQDFLLLERIYEKSRQIQLVTTYVETCLHKRMLGEAEPAAPWDTPGEGSS